MMYPWCSRSVGTDRQIAVEFCAILPPQRPGCQPQLAADGFHRFVHGAVLETGVHLAILTTLILPALPVLPVRLRPEIVPFLEVAFAFDQIARRLPALGRIVHRGPWRAGKLTHRSE